MEKQSKGKIILQLILSFLKIGAFTFGGGYVMIAMIKDEFVENKGWCTDEELLSVFAIAESTPGPVAINAATYVGYKMAGIVGAILSTVFEVLPAFLISYFIAIFFNSFMEYTIVKYAFLGLKAGVAVLILNAGLDFLKKMEKKIANIIPFALSLIAMCVIDFLGSDFSSIYIILIFGITSLIIFSIKNRKRGMKDEHLS